MYKITVFPYNIKRYFDFIKELKKICKIYKKENQFPCIKLEVVPTKEEFKGYLLHILKRKFFDIVVSLNGKGLIEEFSNLLFQKKILVAVAESCTGGLLSHLLTSVPGSSNYFLGGVVSYSNEVKKSLLNIPDLIFKKFGAVHLVTAHIMAKRVQELFGSHLSISTTGIAGPGGGTPIKPVGTICIGICYKDFYFAYKVCDDHRSRELNKLYFAHLAINYARINLLRGISCF